MPIVSEIMHLEVSMHGDGGLSGDQWRHVPYRWDHPAVWGHLLEMEIALNLTVCPCAGLYHGQNAQMSAGNLRDNISIMANLLSR